jgi:hypothetical protein
LDQLFVRLLQIRHLLVQDLPCLFVLSLLMNQSGTLLAHIFQLPF